MTYDEVEPIVDIYFKTQPACPVTFTSNFAAMVNLVEQVKVNGKDFRSQVIRDSQLPYLKKRLQLNYKKRMAILFGVGTWHV
jgi:hypothetical protein